MKCPKCNYTSFDYLTECKKCGQLMDEVKKRLNLQLSKPFVNINEIADQEAESIVEDSTIYGEKTDPFADQEASLADSGEQEEDELIAVSSTTDSLPPLEGLGSMENLQDEDSVVEEKDDIKFESVQTEEDQEITTGFSPSDEQLEELNLQEKADISAEELPELNMEIAEEKGESSEDYDHEKVITLTEDDQIFDLELDLEDK
ncbi:MAG: hypothetical protein U9P07_12510 [Pseudomonadota bacterium]|nr:hypothetical protein [Pseudomonadota bacterium]